MARLLTLYHYWRSSCSWRVRWALMHKDIPFQTVAINLLKGEQKDPEYLKINPSGLVPTLEYEGQFFNESMSILEFLEETFPENPLLPTDRISRVRVRELAMTLIAGTQPLQNLGSLKTMSTDPEERKSLSAFFIREGLHVFEKRLRSLGGASYCIGSQITFADIALIPQCYNALRNHINLEDYPLIYQVYKRCMEDPSCKNSAPANYEP